MVRSCVETAYQLGFERHAAWAALPVSRALRNGHWTAKSARAFASGREWERHFIEAFALVDVDEVDPDGLEPDVTMLDAVVRALRRTEARLPPR